MKTKIKNFFSFIGRAWAGGNRGKAGVIFAIFGVFFFIRMFSGDVSVQKFIINIWQLKSEQNQLLTEQAKLKKLDNHIKLIQNYSPDYVEEIGLKYLNMGTPDTKILKI